MNGEEGSGGAYIGRADVELEAYIQGCATEEDETNEDDNDCLDAMGVRGRELMKLNDEERSESMERLREEAESKSW